MSVGCGRTAKWGGLWSMMWNSQRIDRKYDKKFLPGRIIKVCYALEFIDGAVLHRTEDRKEIDK